MTLYRIDGPPKCSRREFFSRRTPRWPQRFLSSVALVNMVRVGMIAGARPDWLIKAEQQEADADDELDTQRCALEGVQ